MADYDVRPSFPIFIRVHNSATHHHPSSAHDTLYWMANCSVQLNYTILQQQYDHYANHFMPVNRITFQRKNSTLECRLLSIVYLMETCTMVLFLERVLWSRVWNDFMIPWVISFILGIARKTAARRVPWTSIIIITLHYTFKISFSEWLNNEHVMDGECPGTIKSQIERISLCVIWL